MSSSFPAIALRLATPADERGLARLAALDSARVPEGPLLVAEQAGELSAALSLTTGTAIADPFRPTRHLIALLDVQARALVPAPRRRHPGSPSRVRRTMRAFAPAH